MRDPRSTGRLSAAIAAAAEHDLPTVIHIGSWQDLREAATAGATAVTHVPDGEMPADLPELPAERGTFFIPTLAVHSDLLLFLAEPERLDGPLVAPIVGERVRRAYREIEPSENWVRFLEQRYREPRSGRLAAARAMAAAGVPIVAGTDAGNWGTVHGYSLHRELELLVEGGLSSWQSLAAATINAGCLVGRDWGLEPGQLGSVLVLDADPVADIANTQRIHAVVHHGRVIDRDGLLAEP